MKNECSYQVVFSLLCRMISDWTWSMNSYSYLSCRKRVRYSVSTEEGSFQAPRNNHLRKRKKTSLTLCIFHYKNVTVIVVLKF